MWRWRRRRPLLDGFYVALVDELSIEIPPLQERVVLGRFDAQPHAEGLGDEAEARKARVSVFGEGSVEGFAVEAGCFGEASLAALGDAACGEDGR